MPVVSILRGGDPYHMVGEALGLAGIAGRLRPGFKVLLKPNLVRVPSTSPYASEPGAYEKTFAPEGDDIHPEILEAALKTLADLGVKDVTIGEASGGCETTLAYRALGLYEIAEKYGARLLDLNYEESEKVPVPNGFLLDHVWVPRVVRQSDLLINLAVLKVHGSTGVSLCLKNWALGITPGKYYGLNRTESYKAGCEGPLPIHNRGSRETLLGQEVDVSRVIVDVCLAQGYHLSLIDGLTTAHYTPPGQGGEARVLVERTNLVLASDDMVACDAIASMVAGFNPEKILHIKWAAEKGLGAIRRDEVEVRGMSVEEVQMHCNPLPQQREHIIAR